jgi:hypothetical protein
MKKYLCILVLLFCTGVAAIGQASISLTHSNIKHGVMATYTVAGGLVLCFNQNLMDIADKKAYASGKCIVYEKITLTGVECLALHISSGYITKGKGSINKGIGGGACQSGTCETGYYIKIGGAEHKNDWPDK